ncbi:MAG: hypothetical protein Q7R34_06100 [Dehalococcoidia bacterium]|nr:hypothetical protein [Dehalococcoidia bacterium]
MKFRLVYTQRAVRDISRLNPQTKEKIKEALERYSATPLNYAKKMVDPVLGTYKQIPCLRHPLYVKGAALMRHASARGFLYPPEYRYFLRPMQ